MTTLPSSSLAERFKPLIILTLVMLLGLAGVGYIAAKARGVFDPQVRFHFATDTAAGLFEGMQVTFKGFRIGQLTTLRLEGEAVVAKLEIQADQSRFFTQGSYLRISKEKIVTSELALDGVDLFKPSIPQNAALTLIREDVTSDLTKRLDPLVTQMSILLEQLADPQKGVQATLNQFRLTMAETSQAMQQTTVLLRSFNDGDNGMPAVLAETKKTVASLQPVAEQTEQTLKNLDATVISTTKTMVATQKLIEGLSDPKKGVAATMEKTSDLVDELQGTVKDVKRAPVYRLFVPSSKPSVEAPP